jgi:hypothetical protein
MYHLNPIPSERQIKKFIRRTVFGKNEFCPVCRSCKVVRFERRYRCRSWRLKFTLLSHTWLKGMKLSYEKFWMVLWAWTIAIPVAQTTELAHLSRQAAARWHDLFREHLPKDHVMLGKIVQLDEAFFKVSVPVEKNIRSAGLMDSGSVGGQLLGLYPPRLQYLLGYLLARDLFDAPDPRRFIKAELPSKEIRLAPTLDKKGRAEWRVKPTGRKNTQRERRVPREKEPLAIRGKNCPSGRQATPARTHTNRRHRLIPCSARLP